MVLAIAPLPTDAAGTRTSPEGAMSFMTSLSAQMVAALNQPGITRVEQEDTIQQLLRANLDLNLIGRYAIGPAWHRATPKQQHQYKALFAAWVLRTYSKELRANVGRRIETLNAKPVGRQDVLVATRIFRLSGRPLTANWRVRAVGNRFKILDVMVDGASLAVSQRSEFRGIIRRYGVAGLLNLLRSKVAKLAPRTTRRLVRTRNQSASQPN